VPPLVIRDHEGKNVKSSARRSRLRLGLEEWLDASQTAS
jgi:hypothetical protein